METRRSDVIDVERALRAVSNERRLLILHWLEDPRAHFPEQIDGDLVKDGVCGISIADKLWLSQPTVSEHLKMLARLLRGTRIKQLTFYERDDAYIAELTNALSQYF